MRARIELTGWDLLCVHEGSSPQQLVWPLQLERMQEWARRHEQAAGSGDQDQLLALGAQIFQAFDETTWASRWVLGAGARRLDVLVEHADTPEARALLQVPWEILAWPGPAPDRKAKFLSAEAAQPFEVVRKVIGAAFAVQ